MKIDLKHLFLGLFFFAVTNSTVAQHFESVTVTSVSSGNGSSNALFDVSSATIPDLKYIRASVIGGPGTGEFEMRDDNIRYISRPNASGIPNNLSRIRFTFLRSDGTTPINPQDFRFVINDIDGPNNEALGTNCGANVRFTATADPTNLAIDNVLPDLNATGTLNETNGSTSRVMYEFNDISFIEFDNYANNGYLKDFDLNYNNFPISTPLYSVCLDDSDGDGVLDDVDLDDDNDGILDSVEAGGNDPNGDHDGDGLPNFLDSEDNTGDSATYLANADGSVTIYTDANNDGVPDVYESSIDSDELANHLDTDSDGDGCADVDEAYGTGTDTNGDGTYGGVITASDVDANGLVLAAGVSGSSYTTIPSNSYLQASISITGISTHPSNNLLVTLNSTQTFSVVASTLGIGVGINYQWQENSGSGYTNITNGGIYSGATTTTLTLTNVALAHSGNQYRVQLTSPTIVCDTDTTSNAATLTIENQAPVATANSSITNEDVAVTFNVTSDDIDVDGTIDASTVDLDPSLAGKQTSVTTAEGVWTVALNGDVTFTPVANYYGTATLSYTVEDNDGGESNTAALSVLVNSVNDAPIAQNNTYSGNENATIIANIITDNDLVSGLDSDIDSGSLGIQDYNISGISGPQTVGIPVVIPSVGTLTINSDGGLNFVPETGYVGTAPAITYTLTDGSLTATADVTITVTSCLSILTNDCDGDGVTNGDELTPPSGGTVTDPSDACSYYIADVTLAITSGLDCDGDGVLDITEIANGTDSKDGCSYNVADVTEAITSGLDCDGDGVTDKDEITPPNGGTATDPKDSCSLIVADQSVAPNAAWNSGDCDQDGHTNDTDPNPFVPTAADDAFTAPLGQVTSYDILENDDYLPGANTSIIQAGGSANGTISFDSLNGTVSYTPTAAEAVAGVVVTINYQVCHTVPNPDVCETAVITIAITDADDDGDGVPNGKEIEDGSDPNDGCSYEVTSQEINATSTLWKNGDCDGDGVTNLDEVNGSDGDPATTADKTDINDPCSYDTDAITIPITANVDCDGDGVLDIKEIEVGTDPKDACSYNVADITGIIIANKDCDGDGVLDIEEVAKGTDPHDSCSLLLADQSEAPSVAWNDADCDGDSIPNGKELLDGTDPLNECSHTGGVSSGTSDCDEDGLTKDEEIILGTNPDNPDTDGDGVLDGTEFEDKTDPLDNCDLLVNHQTVVPSEEWNNADCDGDTIDNAQEVRDSTDPLDNCDHINGVSSGTSDCDNDGLTYDEELTVSFETADGAGTTDPNNPDTDGDGILDGKEIADGTNPLDPCDSIGGTPPNNATCGLNVHNEIISQNGDSENDYFKINNIEQYPENTVEIFNRWGISVFKTKGYDDGSNVFRGVSNGRSTLSKSEKLPSGIYYFIITYKDGAAVNKTTGYLYIIN